MLPTDPVAESLARARDLDAMGLDHLWTYDHLSWRRYRGRPWFAMLPWLTAVASVTHGLRIGPMVASPNFRHPVAFAQELMTLDHLSGGRLTVGLGAGGVGFDATVYGAEPLPPAARAARLEEFVGLLDHLLRFRETSHHGDYYDVNAAVVAPGCLQQPRAPFAVAAAGPRTIRLAARLGDVWVTTGAEDGSAAEPAARAQAERLDEACAEAGRDPGGIARLFLAGNNDEHPLRSVEAFRDFVGRYEALGFTDVVVHHPRADDPAWNHP